MAKFLRIALWNANGLEQHKEEVKTFLKNNYIDILLVSETHFTEKTYFKIPNYVTYSTNHPDGTAHGGTAVIIKSTIQHYALPKYQKNLLQSTAIKVTALRYDMTVAAVYCPPRHNIKKNDFQEYFQTLGNKFLAGGDYNSKHTRWGSRLVTTKGRELLKTLEDNRYSFLSTGTPTYWPTDPQKVPDLLDFYVTNGINSTYTDVIPSYDLSSDHSPIIATIGTSVIYKKPTPRLHNARTNWDTFRSILNGSIDLNIRLKKTEEIETVTEAFISKLQQAAQQSSPVLQPRKIKQDIPLEIKKLIAEKRRARSKWQRTYAPADRQDYNQISRRLKNRLKEIRNEEFEQYISKLSRTDHSIWKPIQNSKKPTTPAPPVRKNINEPWAKSDAEKANLFAEHLVSVFQPLDNEVDQEIEHSLSIPPVIHTPIKTLSPKEIAEEIKFLNPKKSPGIDLITAKMMKELPRKGIVLLTYIYNAILRLGYWPKCLKTAQIIMIGKPGKEPTDVSSYRPISLLSVISKLLERLVLRRLNVDLPPENWIPDHQFGFRQKHSTVQQVHRITQTVNKALENKQYCSGVFLDISQAFDKVWHPGLIYKIKHILPSNYFNLLKSYLSERTFQTKVNEAKSDYFSISSGVPQGSVLGPLLYVLYTSDLPTAQNAITGTFADDTAILSCHEDPQIASNITQNNLDNLQQWLKKWKIKVNESKSAHITFTLRKETCPAVTINNVQIPQTQAVKYLGLHLDNKLTWKQHITKKRKQMELKARELQWLIGRKSRVSMENKILIYKTVIKPIWTYGLELWGCASKSNIAIIQRCQSKILRQIANAPWYVTNHTLHTDFNVPTVQEDTRKKAITHHDVVENHPNPLMEQLLEPIINKRLKKLWPSELI